MADSTTPLDTRTFPEIWMSLTPTEQTELRFNLMREVFCTRQTIYNWAKGKTPVYRSVRVDAAKTIGKVLGIRTSHTILFPTK